MATCDTCKRELPTDGSPCTHGEAPATSGTRELAASQIIAVMPPPPTAAFDSKPTPQVRAPVDDTLLLERVIDGRYRVRRRLGAGGVGVVFEGEHVEIKKPVAIKVLHDANQATEEFRKRFEREARAASQLSHPSCVSVLDFGRIARLEPDTDGERFVGAPYLVMEFVRGELLYDHLQKQQPSPFEAIAITRGVLSALRHAHSLDLVHRDVKPANIMLTDAGETAPLVKLLDFGLAKNVAEDSPDRQQALTQEGMVFGTPGYLSPEQMTGQPADARSDLYSVGVMLFEMVCGRAPFEGKDKIKVMRDHLLTPPPTPRSIVPSLSPELDAVVLKALAKEPAERWQSAEEMSSALAACPEARPNASSAPSPTPSGPGQTLAETPQARKGGAPSGLAGWIDAHRTLAWAGGGGVVALLVVVVLAIALHSSPPPPQIAPVPPPPMVAPPPALPSVGARHHLLLADDYQRKLWCADAIDELERALHADPQAVTNPDVTRIAIACLRAKTQQKSLRFLVERVGPAAIPQLRAAASSEPKPDVREGAMRALQELGAAP